MSISPLRFSDLLRSAPRALAVVLALATHPAFAQSGEASGLLTADEEMIQRFLRPRSTAELAQELETARQRATEAETDLATASKEMGMAEARVRVKKEEISLLKERARLAKKEGDAAKRTEIEARRSSEGIVLDVFEAMYATAKAQRTRADAALDFAKTRIRLQEVEMRLAAKRDARLGAPVQTIPTSGGGPPVASPTEVMDRDIRSEFRKAIEMLKDYAKRSGRLADTTGDLAKTRLRLLDAWEAYLAR